MPRSPATRSPLPKRRELYCIGGLDLAAQHLRQLGALRVSESDLDAQALAVVGGLQHLAAAVQPSHDLAGAIVEVELDHRAGDGEAAVDEVKEPLDAGALDRRDEDDVARADARL